MAEMDAHEANGRATIREVHALLTETRHENEKQLGYMEERLMRAIYASEDRIVESMSCLATRVTRLEEWRDESTVDRKVAAARREGRMAPVRITLDWASAHWQILVIAATVIVLVMTFLLDTNITVHPTF